MFEGSAVNQRQMCIRGRTQIHNKHTSVCVSEYLNYNNKTSSKILQVKVNIPKVTSSYIRIVHTYNICALRTYGRLLICTM